MMKRPSASRSRRGVLTAPLGFLVVAGLGLSVVACSDDGNAPDSGVGSDQNASDGTQQSDALVQTYSRVLDDPAAYPVPDTARYDATGTYSYAVVEATGDDTPELLLRVDGEEFSPVLVFTTADEGSELVQVDNAMIMGAASSGGSRAALEASESGQGIHQILSQSVNPTAENTLYVIEDNALVSNSSPESFQVMESLPDHQTIEWFELSDRSGLESAVSDSATGGQASPTTTSSGPNPTLGNGQQPGSSTQPDPGSSAAENALTGTVVNMTTSEVMNGQPAPNGEPETDGYYVLQLDGPQQVTAISAGSGPSTDTVTEVSLGAPGLNSNGHNWSQYVGERITVIPGDMHFPSDTSLPLGMVRLSSVNDVQTQ